MTVNVTKPSLNLREEIAKANKPSGIAGEALLRADSVQDARDLIGAGRKNLVINGSMAVSQRGTTFSAPQSYTLDRYKSLRYAAGNYTISQQSAGLQGFDKCARLQRNAGDTSTNSFAYNQPLEAKDTFALRGKTVTFSAYVRAGADFSCSNTTLRIGYHNTAGEYGVNYSNFTAATTYAADVSFDFRGQSEWKRISVTGQISDDAIQVCAAIQPQGFSGTAGSSDYLETTGWQLELGSVATDFEHRSYGEELALCKRYFEMIGEKNGVTPAGGDAYCSLGMNGIASGSNNYSAHLTYTTKRVVPTISSDAASGFRIGSNNHVQVASINFSNTTTTACEVWGTTASSVLTIGYGANFFRESLNDCRIYIDAEL